MNEFILSLLREHSKIPPEDIEECLKVAEESGRRLDQVLIAKGLISEEELLKISSSVWDIPYYEDIGDFSVPGDFVTKVPLQFARRASIVALSHSDGAIKVALADPFESHILDDISSMLGIPVEPVFATRAMIERLISKAYQEESSLTDEVLEEFVGEEELVLGDVASTSEDLLDIAQKAPIIRLVNTLLLRALRLRASDIHIQPYEEKLQIRYRIDGILYDMFALPKNIQEEVVSRVKVMARMDIAERRMAQDGRTTVRLGGREIDLRISVVPTFYGERVVLRLLDKGARLYTLSELGLNEEDFHRLRNLVLLSHGLHFVTGPTGSGKTTTLYACLANLNAAEKNIITLEDPIEYQLRGISQIQVGLKKGLTFATGLRSVLRQDPDIIMVGEVRDLETARMAIQSAQTGHLVFSTLHTNDSAGAVTRLLDIGIEPYLVASSVIAVMAQRLVRLVCPNCREEYEPDERTLMEIGLSTEETRGKKFCHGRGCEECLNTGYKERTGIFELLVIDDVVREQIVSRAGSSEIKKLAVQRGLKTLRMDGAAKVLTGLTTPEEVLRVTQLDVS